jgi:hypothetical protein
MSPVIRFDVLSRRYAAIRVQRLAAPLAHAGAQYGVTGDEVWQALPARMDDRATSSGDSAGSLFAPGAPQVCL